MRKNPFTRDGGHSVIYRIVILLSSFLLATSSFATEEADFTGPSTCLQGRAANYYGCQNVNLAAQVNLNKLGVASISGNDIWGWTDPETGAEIAIMGLNNKTAFVDVTNPAEPVHLGDLATKTTSSIWRDIKVYKNHAYIVSEAYGHGMQIFDLTLLRDVKGGPIRFAETAYYGNFGSAHNVFINEDTGYAYAVGSDTCDAGMHMVDIRNPIKPSFVGCIDRAIFEDVRPEQKFLNGLMGVLHGEDYTHDVQCVIYKGPHVAMRGREICVASNADTVNVVDVTDKSNPVQLAVSGYKQLGYTHQGWLSEDHKYFFLGDELDEMNIGVSTTTIVWDLTDLTAPKEHFRFVNSTRAIDHNMYVKGNYLYQANYNSGLRILDISGVAEKKIVEAGFFDTNPNKDTAEFDGVWSVYPFFNSDTAVVSGTNGHLYIVKPNLKK